MARTRSRNRRLAAWLGAKMMALVAIGCAEDVGRLVAVEPAPAPAAINFMLTDRRLFYGLTVSTCRGRTMWTIRNERLTLPPVRIGYGVTPPGFTTVTGPAPLGSGCYVVTVSGPSRERFYLGPDGRLILDSSAAASTSR